MGMFSNSFCILTHAIRTLLARASRATLRSRTKIEQSESTRGKVALMVDAGCCEDEENVKGVRRSTKVRTRTAIKRRRQRARPRCRVRKARKGESWQGRRRLLLPKARVIGWVIETVSSLSSVCSECLRGYASSGRGN